MIIKRCIGDLEETIEILPEEIRALHNIAHTMKPKDSLLHEKITNFLNFVLDTGKK